MSELGRDWRLRVLVIDPDPEERWNQIYYAQCCGFRAIGVATGREGLRCLSRCLPDVIISALVLPDMSGIRLLECATHSWPPVKVVLTAKWRTRALHDQVSRERASDLLRHPVREREILAAFARCLAARIDNEEWA